MTDPGSTERSAWDLLVVGGGAAGLVAAHTAARLGARVVLVERERTGGDCLWTGCVPSKALLAAAAAAAGARRTGGFGIDVASVEVDGSAVLRHVREVITTIEPVDSPDALRAAGVHVVAADLRFTGPRTAEAGGRTLHFRRAVIATGSVPRLPDVPGLAEAAPLTTDTVWDLTDLRGRLVVLGGGSAGCELAQAFARLGTAVTLVEAAARLLPEVDPDASALVRAALEADGVTVLVGRRATSARRGVLELEDAVLEHDALLVAAGRRPGTAGLGLEAAGVELDPEGWVRVDDRLRTTSPGIWAAGDVTGLAQLTHVGGSHGSLAASNAVLGLRRRVDLRVVPRVVLTDPEVGTVGAPSWASPSARSGRPPRTVTRHNEHVDRAVAERRTDGFTRLVLDRRHRVVGATLVGPRAGEALAEVTLAVRDRLTTASLAGTLHAYPTYADGAWTAAVLDVESRLAARPVQAVLRAVARARRLRAP